MLYYTTFYNVYLMRIKIYKGNGRERRQLWLHMVKIWKYSWNWYHYLGHSFDFWGGVVKKVVSWSWSTVLRKEFDLNPSVFFTRAKRFGVELFTAGWAQESRGIQQLDLLSESKWVVNLKNSESVQHWLVVLLS